MISAIEGGVLEGAPAELRAKIDAALDLRLNIIRPHRPVKTFAFYDRGVPGAGRNGWTYLGAYTGNATNAAPRALTHSHTELDQILKQEVVHVPGPTRDVRPTDLVDKPDWVYWILLPTGRVKMGRSHHPKANRLASYQTLFEEELKIVSLVKCPNRSDGMALESRLKTALAPFKVEGFATELFTADILPKFEIADLVDGEVVPRD